MAYDALRQESVLYLRAATWVWDGFDWTQRSPAASPNASTMTAMAFDSARGRTILFGGLDSRSRAQGETWAWDGANWTLRSPASSPGPWVGHGMVEDRARGRLVLFGGGPFFLGRTSATWEWDGSTWIDRSSAKAPPPRTYVSMAYDARRQRVVVYGGFGPGGVVLGDTWEWDGADWQQIMPPSSPGPRFWHSMAYDAVSQQVVLSGGQSGTASSSVVRDVWQWNGTTWTERAASPAPAARRETALTYDRDRGRVVLYGGLTDSAYPWRSDTWEWDGRRWTPRDPSRSPRVLTGHRLAYDRVRKRTVLFGGQACPTPRSTWEWDGTDWDLKTVAESPRGRTRHAMFFDPNRGTVVVMGGVSTDGACRTGPPLDDMWEWDGSRWSLITVSPRPSARAGAAVAYDEARRRVVLYGGTDAASFRLNDTWEWDGSTWQLRTPTQTPAHREFFAAYDARRQRVVLHNGNDPPWEWDGTNWQPAAAVARSPVFGLAYHENQEHLLLLAEYQGETETWLYGASPLASQQAVGTGCGAVQLAAMGQPVLGSPRFALDLDTGKPTAPAVLLLSTGPANIPLGGACTLLVDMTGSSAALGVVTNGRGWASLTLPVPSAPVLGGSSLWSQAGILDASQSAGVALSSALQLTLGV